MKACVCVCAGARGHTSYAPPPVVCLQNDDQRCGVVTRGKRSTCLFLCVDSQKGFFPGVESFFFLCVWTARWHGFSFLPRSGVLFLSVCVDSPVARLFFVGCPAPPRGKGGPGGQRPPSVPKTLFSERPFYRGYSLETVLFGYGDGYH